MLFFGCLTSVEPIGKGFHRVLINSLHPYFNLAHINQNLPVQKFNTALYGLYFSHKGWFSEWFSEQNFAYVG